jgi:hypothetical protein
VLWEFGHALWRPLGYVLAPVFLALVPDTAAWTPSLKIAYGLGLLNLIAGLAAAVLLYDLGRRLMGPRQALLPVLLLVWSDAVLGYSRSATSYVFGLAMKTYYGSVFLAGLAGLFWLPYAIAIPAACCVCMFVRLKELGRQPPLWRHILAGCIAAGAVLLGGILLAAALAGIHTRPEFASWMAEAGHGLRQNRQWMRVVSGCTRLFLELGKGGVLLKYYAFHDPYSPITVAQLFRSILWKIGSFYVFLGAIVLLALRSQAGRCALVPLALAGVPALLAATFVFEPSAPERFLPVLPFLLLAIMAAWNDPRRRGLPFRAAIWGFALLLPAVNLPAFEEHYSTAYRQTHTALEAFRNTAGSGNTLAAITISDPMIQLLAGHPFDSLNRPPAIQTFWAVDTMNADAPNWPRRFAREVLLNWRRNREVWIEKAALAARPDPRLLWVEGDNPQVHWQDVPAFFRTLEVDADLGGPDGFLRLHRSRAAEARLEELSRP